MHTLITPEFISATHEFTAEPVFISIIKGNTVAVFPDILIDYLPYEGDILSLLLTKIPCVQELKSIQLHHLFYTFNILFPEYFKKQIEMVDEFCCGKGYCGMYMASKLRCSYQGRDINRSVLECIPKTMKILNFKHAFTTINQNLLLDTIEFKPDSLNLALHACGYLSTAIIKAFSQSLVPGTLLIIPCCYPKFRGNYEWLSEEYKTLKLTLSQVILRSILSQPKGDYDKQTKMYIFKRHTRIIKILTCLIAGVYIPIPDSIMNCNPTNVSLYSQHLSSILHHLNIQHEDSLDIQIDRLIPQATIMIDQIEMLESRSIVQYRRFYELMILEDHVLYLRSHGLTATMFAYTHTSITPRNICIFAHRD
jgi:hypothetical protein